MKRSLILLLLFAALALLIVFALGAGRYPVSMLDTASFLWAYALGRDTPDTALMQSLIFDIRLPRILAAVLIGSALAVCGAVFQAMFVNPLVSPGLLGVLAGAGFGAALGMVFSDSWLAVQVMAFGFGFAAVGVALGLAALFGRGPGGMLVLVLGGVISGSLFTALLSILKFTADPYDKLPAIVYWLMGSLSLATAPTIGTLIGPMMISLAFLVLMGKLFNVMSLGEEEARSLGINTTVVRLSAIVLATALSAMTVVLAGIIGWVGLVIPHIVRMILGPDNRWLLPGCALFGGLFLLAVDTAGRSLFPTEIPVGILTSLIGIPIFALVLKNAKKGFA
ncbi:MAG: FecCD family ABC transporter permease [Campylobacterales bacterium]